MRSLSVLLAATVVAAGIPASADAQHHYRTYRSDRDTHRHYVRCRKHGGTTGAVVGGAAGGLLGHALLGGTGGTLVGVAGGALGGRAIERNGKVRCR